MQVVTITHFVRKLLQCGYIRLFVCSLVELLFWSKAIAATAFALKYVMDSVYADAARQELALGDIRQQREVLSVLVELNCTAQASPRRCDRPGRIQTLLRRVSHFPSQTCYDKVPEELRKIFSQYE